MCGTSHQLTGDHQRAGRSAILAPTGLTSLIITTLFLLLLHFIILFVFRTPRAGQGICGFRKFWATLFRKFWARGSLSLT